jgi:uncharacterized protein YndB with AHSA1/START domain
MAEINHEIKIKAAPDRVFAALTTVEGLKSWHSAHVEGHVSVGRVLKFVHSGKPTFRWEITELDAPKRVAWQCVEGPGDSVGTRAIFELSPTDDGRTLVECAHMGWPGTHGNYRKCNTLWGILLHHLKQYAETDKAAPAFT